MILSGVHQASALLEYQTPLELYNEHELIVMGKVISLTEISNRETIYNVKVEEYLKNPKPYDLIDAYGRGAKSSGEASSVDIIFEIGDRVLLYLDKEDEKYKVSPYSFKAPLACGKHQLLQLATIPGEPRSISSPANNSIHLANTSGTEIETFVVNEGISIDYDLINNNPQSNSVELEITIMTDSAKVFHANQSIPLESCTQTTISWHFTPTKTGEYTVNVTSDDIYASTDFHVRLNTTGGSLDKTPYDTEWKTLPSVGKYLYNEPQRPPQIFNVQYRMVNGTLNSITSIDGSYSIEASTVKENGLFELKIPLNYPSTNFNNVTAAYMVMINNENMGNIFGPSRLDECFFGFSIPFSGNVSINLAPGVIPEHFPYHGEEVPTHCIKETILSIPPLQQLKAGISAADVVCKEGLELIVKSTNGNRVCVKPTTAEKLLQRGWGILPLRGLPTS